MPILNILLVAAAVLAAIGVFRSDFKGEVAWSALIIAIVLLVSRGVLQ